jgi:hypothetical protein
MATREASPVSEYLSSPKGLSEMHFNLVVVDGGNEMLAIETDAGTVVSGTLAKGK